MPGTPGIIQRHHLLIGSVNFLRGGVILQGRFPCAKIFHLQITFAGMVCELAAVHNLGGTGLSGITDNAVGTGFGILCGLNKRRILRYLIRWPVRERLRNRFAGIPLAELQG